MSALYRTFAVLVFLMFSVQTFSAQQVHIRIATTSDVHANFFPWDFAAGQPNQGSLAHVKTFVDANRAIEGQHVILMDNADLLQGQPTGYYFNFVSDRPVHFISDAMNLMGYDVASVGNHDVEMGPEVYNRLSEEFNFPWLAANILHVRTGKPYFEPYTIIEREGVRIAVIGLVTPSVPNWLPRKLWEGLEFTSMYSAASYWMNHIRENEKADAVVGLFHSGPGPDIDYAGDSVYLENAALYVGKYVPGFDVIFTAHDHRERNETFINAQGEEVLFIGPRPYAQSVGLADLFFVMRDDGSFVLTHKEGSLENMSAYQPDPEFMEIFAEEKQEVLDFVNQPLGVLENQISSRDAYFGNAGFTDFIHHIQMELTGATVSFAAPLSFDATLAADTLFMRDMFTLYPYENYLYVMELSGQEIHDFLEYSYSTWFNTMESAEDHLLYFRKNRNGELILDNNGRARTRNIFFNFDSAAGIDYTVDVSEEPGDRITIKGFTSGESFNRDQKYRVAINSYRGSGGGGHITEGAGIDHNKLENRIVWVSEKDLRTHIADFIESKQVLNAERGTNWKVIPEEWAGSAAQRDRTLLFGE